ncbi:zinc-binding protein A33-like [Archocentrus centrarchus]|uniref:zinc-binding protein A33-like n=1 Tax=Archocentrus centrarchus TaxID=63155 RepID=UPI0011EA095B|nr:zinc-binding protein A33-like [Archocentrus centrarchus]
MASLLSEVQFQCSICLESFKNPVSIPCGHNFCLECIKHYWDVVHRSDCPLCKENFKKRPELRINVGLREITENFQRSVKERQAHRPVPAKRHHIKRQSSKPEPVPCDICQENKLAAVKFCHVCQASYCENHLAPHLRDPVMVKHRLTDPATFSKSPLCRHHNKVLEKFCKKDHMPVCMTCIEKDHKHHELVPVEKEINRIKTKVKKTQEHYQHMMQSRLKKAEEINESVELSKRNKEKDIQTSVQAATKMISVIEENQALLIEEIERKHEAAERKAEELLKEINQEVNELENRSSELEHLEHTENPFLLLQSSSHLSAPASIKHWSDVKVQSENYIMTVRKTFSKLADICHELEKEMSAEEVSRANKYAVDVTLDPATAAGWLVLSPDSKTVSLSSLNFRNLLPDNPRRFDSCVAVLGKQSFTSGKHYWVVQVGNKRDWDLGVARESINRKGAITVCPDNGYWAICRRKGGSLCACTGPSITLHLNEIPQKVGIFLDCEEGVVSYNTEAKTHVYTYSGLTFTEPLYPYFNPCLHDNGLNTAPLVICPVEDAVSVDPEVI